MKALCLGTLLLLLAQAFGATAWDGESWVYIVNRPADDVATAEALSSTDVNSGASACVADDGGVDSFAFEEQAGEPGGLDSTPRGGLILVR